MKEHVVTTLTMNCIRIYLRFNTSVRTFKRINLQTNIQYIHTHMYMPLTINTYVHMYYIRMYVCIKQIAIAKKSEKGPKAYNIKNNYRTHHQFTIHFSFFFFFHKKINTPQRFLFIWMCGVCCYLPALTKIKRIKKKIKGFLQLATYCVSKQHLRDHLLTIKTKTKKGLNNLKF